MIQHKKYNIQIGKIDYWTTGQVINTTEDFIYWKRVFIIKY